jgi:uncharacterized protein
MKFPHSDQMRLLDLQAVDLELSQVRRRMGSLPIAAEVVRLEQRAADLHHQIVTSQTESADLGRMVAKAEEELGRVRARAQRDREIAGSGVAPRVQQDLQHELTSLARRLGDLEDAELEMMQREEDLVAQLDRLQALEVDLTDRLAVARSDRDSELLEESSRLESLTGQRTKIRAEVPGALLALYERSRSDSGVGAAVIKGNQCQGCRLQLPPSELVDLRTMPADEIAHCEECGCILVRDMPADSVAT